MRAHTQLAFLVVCLASSFVLPACKQSATDEQQAATQSSPGAPGVADLLAEAQTALDAGEASKAATLAREALEARGDSLAAQEILGLALYDQGLLEEAAEPLFAVVQERQGDLGTRLACVEALDVAARFDDAIKAAQATIEVAPDEIDGYLALGLLLLKTGQYEDAIGPLENAADLAPTAAPIWVYAARARIGAGQYDEAADLIDIALHAAADAEGSEDTVSEATLLLAQIHLARADNPPAAPEPPGDTDPESDEGIPESAPADIPAALSEPPQDDESLAASYIAEFERQVDAAEAPAAIGAMLVEAGRFEQARDRLEGLRKDAPTTGHTAYAQALLALGERFDLALDEASLGAEGTAPSAEALAVLGWAQWKTGDHEAAAATLGPICGRLAAPMTRARATYQLSRALDASGRAEEAAEALAEAQSLGYPVDTGG